MRVDLPAPLSPASATTSPGWTRTNLAEGLHAAECLETLRTERIVAASLDLASSGETALGLVDQHGDDDHGADGDVLPERLDVDEHQPIVDHGDDEGAGDRTPDGAGAAEQAGTADDDRSDRTSSSGSPAWAAPAEKRAGVDHARDPRQIAESR